MKWHNARQRQVDARGGSRRAVTVVLSFFTLVAVVVGMPANPAGASGSVVWEDVTQCDSNGNRTIKATVTNTGGRFAYFAINVERSDGATHASHSVGIRAGATQTIELGGIISGTWEARVVQGGTEQIGTTRRVATCGATATAECNGYLRTAGFPIPESVLFPCRTLPVGGNFDVFYDPNDISDAEALEIQQRLEDAKARFGSWGFTLPTGTVRVLISHRVHSTTGYSPPGRIELKASDAPYSADFLAHEMFHQFQWVYAGDMTHEQLMALPWIEAQAEWAACSYGRYNDLPTGRYDYCKTGTGYYDYPHTTRNVLAPGRGASNYNGHIFFRHFEKEFGLAPTVTAMKSGNDFVHKMWNTASFGATCPGPSSDQCSHYLHKFRRQTSFKYPSVVPSSQWYSLDGSGGAKYYRPPTGTTGKLRITVRADSDLPVVRVSLVNCGSMKTKDVSGVATRNASVVLDFSGCTYKSRLVVTNVKKLDSATMRVERI